jgi:hypothetical protein
MTNLASNLAILCISNSQMRQYSHKLGVIELFDVTSQMPFQLRPYQF